ncbi:four-carbon acid sugar kinase family protein [Edwardsiella piscicida]|nr:four-carbon acid sugar kinase family protein [Edwardsiella piscicida]ELM3729469.1 four-carbon acid sugar kinase family protein [Edwardsiella piscicida]ELV7537039.1 four-carbon acid sugar kinase family protein [Edwardsiella piscicida]
MSRLGVIADDFTGATDIASFLVENGVATVQFNGVPSQEAPPTCRALVISLKIRACPPHQAIAQALRALAWLQRQGCHQFYYKYCSTFDSTAQGNIGPVTDALMQALRLPLTVLSPALPINGRTVYQGYLFVMDRLLAESSMRHHPLNPMRDSYLPRLMEAQASGRCAVIPLQTLARGADATRQALEALRQEGYRYAVLDATEERHLHIQGEALADLALVTGGSGLAIGLARRWAHRAAAAHDAGYPRAGRAIVLSGSCSAMTQRQVAHYAARAPWRQIEVDRCLTPEARRRYADELSEWALAQPAADPAPLLSATVSVQQLTQTHAQHGPRASQAVEALFSALSERLAAGGIVRFIVAGGETAGAVSQALGVSGFYIGPTIAPGVPWVNALNRPLSLALKSGNFGTEAFFTHAQSAFPV